jgi:hypothetical protein
MTLLWQISLALEVGLLVVFALVVATSVLTRTQTGSATIRDYPRRHVLHGRHRHHRAA